VEAARAGEAGAGFAVVADEVRNLAMRAADAAKNTATLIEGTAAKVKAGSTLVDKTGEAFSLVSDNTRKVKELVGEIAAASREQAHGVDQINKAITEMNQIIQQVAANAEESASASEELNAQSEKMQDLVLELGAMVVGHNHGWQQAGNACRANLQSHPEKEDFIVTHQAGETKLVSRF
jgi:methyl-accepting chemotaxis protein